MLRKWISVLLLLTVLMTSLSGCGMDLVHGIIKEYEDNKDGIKSELHELKDGIKNEFNDWMGSISQYCLTEDNNLKGEREFGGDDYVGSYEAEYIRFNGEEYIFGGTSMERENTAALYWLGSTDEHIIFGDKDEHIITEVTAEDVYEFTFNVGDNFIVLKGDDFTGSLSLKVE